MGTEASEQRGRQAAGRGKGGWALRPPPPAAPAARPPLRPRPPARAGGRLDLALSGLAAAGAGRQVEEAAGGVAAVVTWLLGEPALWLGGRADELLSWKRPLHSLLAFVGANLVFW